jgi:soluble lytic murein transglycosylase-like protein
MTLSASSARVEGVVAETRWPGMRTLGLLSETAVAPAAQSLSVAPNKVMEALAAVVAGKYRVSEEATRDLVRTAFREGTRIGVDPLLIISVIAVESGFNPIAESNAGALGLMQVIPRYHADKFHAVSAQSVLDPETNIHVGAKILREYIARDGSQLAGLQRYNGSSGDPSNAYANKVLGEKQWLQQAMRRLGREAG